jgi:hypothetical protein
VPKTEIRKEEVHMGFWWGNLRDEFKERGVDWGIILRWIFRKWDAGRGWADFVEEKARWRSLVN